jgi:hypothetical protein
MAKIANPPAIICGRAWLSLSPAVAVTTRLVMAVTVAIPIAILRARLHIAVFLMKPVCELGLLAGDVRGHILRLRGVTVLRLVMAVAIAISVALGLRVRGREGEQTAREGNCKCCNLERGHCLVSSPGDDQSGMARVLAGFA